MINLAESRARCECGSNRLAPVGNIEPGTLAICGACAATFRVTVALVPVPWSTVDAELEAQPFELQAFQWTRAGVPLALRRTLPELAARGEPRRAAERSAVALFVCFAVALVLLVLKAVHS